MDQPQQGVTFFRYLYLMGAMQQIQLINTVRWLALPAELAHLDNIKSAWIRASKKMASLNSAERNIPDQSIVANPPESILQRLREISEDQLFKSSFSALPTDIKIVELDHIVAPQREVNLDYVNDLKNRIPGQNIEDLVEFCVGPRTSPPELSKIQIAQNQMVFSSRSLDLRFLGGFPKPITNQDIAVAHWGGQPVETIDMLIGFGAAPINAWIVGKRLILGNGFHRVIALRMSGITNIPIVIQYVSNPEIEFPDHYLGLTRTYLLQDPRPVLIKDFFDQDLTIELHLKPRKKTLKITWTQEDSIVPE